MKKAPVSSAADGWEFVLSLVPVIDHALLADVLTGHALALASASALCILPAMIDCGICQNQMNRTFLIKVDTKEGIISIIIFRYTLLSDASQLAT